MEQLIKMYRRGNLLTERLFPRYFYCLIFNVIIRKLTIAFQIKLLCTRFLEKQKRVSIEAAQWSVETIQKTWRVRKARRVGETKMP